MTVEPLMPAAPALRGPTLMTQQWRDLTFVHWAVEPERVQRFMPPGVSPDVLDGRTYVGLVPFRMVGAGIGRGPAVPYLGTFLETNVRLYSVDATGRRGIVFLSLDCQRALVCAGARLAYGIPYRWARMSHTRDGDRHTYVSHLLPRGGHARVEVVAGASTEAAELEHFLTARWGCTAAGWAARGSSPTSTSRGRCGVPTCSTSTRASSPRSGCRTWWDAPRTTSPSATG